MQQILLMKKQTQNTTKQNKRLSGSKIRLPFKLTRWTAIIAVSILLTSADITALVIQRAQNDTIKPSPETTSLSNPTQSSKPQLDTASEPTKTTPPQPTTTTQSGNSTKSNTVYGSASTLDQYGCATNTPSYSQCVQNKRQLLCNDQVSAPASAFSSATIQARATYNSVMNEWEIAQYQTPHNAKSEYLADATAKFNAIYEPAYNSYFAKVQSINSQGCNLSYPTRESPGQNW